MNLIKQKIEQQELKINEQENILNNYDEKF